MDRDALSARLLQLFVEELEDHVRAINGDLLALESDPADAERLRSLFRAAHTLKGAARAAGAPEVETACHAMEELLAAVRDGARRMDEPAIRLLFAFADALQDAAARLREGRPLAGSPVEALPDVLAGRAPVPDPAPPPAPAPAPPAPAAAPARPDPPPPSAPAPAPPTASAPVREMAPVRVSPERLDELLASAGELLALARRAEARGAELRALDQHLGRWSVEWQREGERLRRLRAGGAADAGEPGGDAVAAVGERIHEVTERVRRLARDAGGDARQLDRAADDLAGQIRRLRMRPLQEALEGLPRTVRDLAEAAGKEVRLEVEGGEVEVDRAVLEALREAVLPVVRNAVDHGMETPDARVRAGKPAEATLRVAAALVGDRVVVTVADDGAGVDADALRGRLAAAGAPVPRDDAGLAEALLSGGVSSRATATRISGRGVGLDIVRASMERVRGGVTLRWEPGRGTSVRLEFPPSLALVRALLLTVGPQVLAIPTLAVERLVRARVESLRSVEGRPVLSLPGGPVPLVPLARVLGPPLLERPLAGMVRVVVLAAGGERAALLVDELLAEEELVLRPLNTGRAVLPMIAGAATLASGGVAPLLDAGAVVAAALGGGGPLRLGEPEGTGPRRVLIADDSLTTRALEQSLLEAAGFTVLTAVDGLDAWRLLQEEPVDLLVSDVEMPRMDGFRLCETVRASPRLRELPVVLVTARESAEDRARGLEAGADAYLPKSSFDQEQLLRTIERLLD